MINNGEIERIQINVTRSSLPPYEEFIEMIKPIWDSRWLTNMGDFHSALEEALKDYLDVAELSLMVNGHMALELAIQAYGFPVGSEIITTPFTFISTTHAIVRNGLQPVFCDVKPIDGTMDPAQLEKLITPQTVAILPVHVYGNVCDVESIQEIADRHGLKVIYDAAHVFGVTHNGKGIGSYGDCSMFSFHATKVYHTIEGGAVASSDRELYEKLYNLKNFGIRGEELVTDIGANAKMNEFCAVMGLCNLRHIGEAMESRKQIYARYEQVIAGINGLVHLTDPAQQSRNFAYYPILVTEEYPCDRDALYERFADAGIHVRKYFYPLTADAACFGNRYAEAELPIARDLAGRVLTLPIFEGMTEEEFDRVATVLEREARS